MIASHAKALSRSRSKQKRKADEESTEDDDDWPMGGGKEAGFPFRKPAYVKEDKLRTKCLDKVDSSFVDVEFMGGLELAINTYVTQNTHSHSIYKQVSSSSSLPVLLPLCLCSCL